MTNTKATLAEEGLRMNDDQIKYMIDRFLGWRLPEPWNPDNGISYQRPNYAHAPSAHDWPTGTNLFDSDQAAAMVRYMIEGLPGHPTPPAVEASDLLEQVSRAMCKRRATSQCAAICLTRFASNNRDGQCPDAVRVFGGDAKAAVAAIRREAAASSSRDAVIEECARVVADKQETITEAQEGSVRHVTPRRVGNLAGLAFVDAIRALKSSPASPTELEKELTAALRKAQALLACNGEQSGKIDAAVAKATERGL